MAVVAQEDERRIGVAEYGLTYAVKVAERAVAVQPQVAPQFSSAAARVAVSAKVDYSTARGT